MAKKNAWKIELKLLSRFLNMLANNDFKWRDGEGIMDFKPFCSSEIIILVEESPKVISYMEHYFYNSATMEEYNLIEVTEKMLKGMESVLQSNTPCGNEGVFKPEYEQTYWFISQSWESEVDMDQWSDHQFDENRYAVGNCFPTRQAAEDSVRVLKLIQKARESQDGFVPDWEGMTYYKHSLYFDSECKKVHTISVQTFDITPTFGYWKDESVCEQFIDENRDELIWFFTEYRR